MSMKTSVPTNANITPLKSSLRDAVWQSVDRFIKECGDMAPKNLYRLVQEEIEEPMLRLLMEKANNNQCEVTRWLGLARGTVRKKLKQFGLIK